MPPRLIVKARRLAHRGPIGRPLGDTTPSPMEARYALDVEIFLDLADREVQRTIRENDYVARSLLHFDAGPLLVNVDWKRITEAYQPVTEHLVRVILDEIPKANTRIRSRRLTKSFAFSFSLRLENAERWARNYGSRRIVEITEQMRETIRRQIETAIRQGIPPERLARMIQVGPTAREAAAFARREFVSEAGRERAYRRVVRRRALRIARTETVAALNGGYREAAIAQVGTYLKPGAGIEWVAGPGACSICVELDTKIVDLEGGSFTGIDQPPAHPGCRCTITVVPVEDRPDRAESFAPQPTPTPPPSQVPSQVPIGDPLDTELPLGAWRSRATPPTRSKDLDDLIRSARDVNEELSQVIGRDTAWSGRIEFGSDRGAYAVKTPSCAIRMNRKYWQSRSDDGVRSIYKRALDDMEEKLRQAQAELRDLGSRAAEDVGGITRGELLEGDIRTIETTLHQYRLRYYSAESDPIATLIHESLHSASRPFSPLAGRKGLSLSDLPTSRAAAKKAGILDEYALAHRHYGSSMAIEEATVEAWARHLVARPQFARFTRIPDDLRVEIGLRRQSYDRAVKTLEAFRENLGLDVDDFYRALINTPARDRLQLMDDMLNDAVDRLDEKAYRQGKGIIEQFRIWHRTGKRP